MKIDVRKLVGWAEVIKIILEVIAAGIEKQREESERNK